MTTQDLAGTKLSSAAAKGASGRVADPPAMIKFCNNLARLTADIL
jgi:hypothetical protein